MNRNFGYLIFGFCLAIVLSSTVQTIQAQESPRIMAMRLYSSEFAKKVRDASKNKDSAMLAKLLQRMKTRAEKVEAENSYYTKSLYRRMSQIGAQFPRTYKFAAIAAQRLGEFDPALELEALNIIWPTYVEKFNKEKTPRIAKPMIHHLMRTSWLSAQNADEQGAYIALDRVKKIANSVNMTSLVEPQVAAFRKELPEVLAFAEKMKPFKMKVNDIQRDPEAVAVLFNAYFVEKDEPSSAIPYVDPSKQTLVKFAYRPLGSATGKQYDDLSKWYKEVADEVEDEDQKIAMLIRSSVYASEGNNGSYQVMIESELRKLKLSADVMADMQDDLRDRIGYTKKRSAEPVQESTTKLADANTSKKKFQRPKFGTKRFKSSREKPSSSRTSSSKNRKPRARKVATPDFRRPTSSVMGGEGASIFDFPE